LFANYFTDIVKALYTPPFKQIIFSCDRKTNFWCASMCSSVNFVDFVSFLKVHIFFISRLNFIVEIFFNFQGYGCNRYLNHSYTWTSYTFISSCYLGLGSTLSARFFGEVNITDSLSAMLFSTGVGWWARSYSIFCCLDTQNAQRTSLLTNKTKEKQRLLEPLLHLNNNLKK